MPALLQNRSEPRRPLPATAAQPRRIVLIDDHPIVSSGLSALINYEPDLHVCGVAENYASALQMIERLDPDLIISDVSWQGRDGLDLLKDIKKSRPHQPVLMLSMHDESLYAARALRAGASGYVMKQEAMETILLAIHQVLAGEIYLSEPLSKMMIRQRFNNQSAAALDPLTTLTDRELEVFRMIGQGKSTAHIARELHLSIKTIEGHRAHLKQKLNLTTGRELLREAVLRQKTHFGVECPLADAVPPAPVRGRVRPAIGLEFVPGAGFQITSSRT